MAIDMYEILIGLQYVGIVILVAQLIYVLCQPPSRIQTMLMILTFCCLVNFVGYLFEMKSTSMDSSLQAVKMIYVGKPYIILSMVMIIAIYCNVKIPRWVIAIVITASVSVTFLVLTCEYQNLYYKSIDYTTEGMFPHLVFGYGIVYIIYTFGFTILYYLSSIIICVKRYKKANTKIEKIQIKFFLAIMSVGVFFLGLYMSKTTGGYDCTLMGYVISISMLSFSIYRLRLFDVAVIAKEQAIDSFEDGVVVFNNSEKLIYSNKPAMAIIETVYAETKGENQEYHELAQRLKDICTTEERCIFTGDRVYEVSNSEITKGSVVYGRMFMLRDITDSHDYTTRLQEEVMEKTEHIKGLQNKITLGMADMVESRDSNTGGHIKRTSEVIRIFVQELRDKGIQYEVPENFYENVIDAAPMHDLGKIAVADEILRKPGAFTKEEYEEMKTHAEKGASIVQQVLSGIEDEEFLNIATNIAHYHHEKYNGEGYPCGLKGEAIPLEARIMALADVFDALVSKRCYKEKMSYEKAFSIIEESLGSHFDEKLGREFLGCREQLIHYYDRMEAEA